MTKCIYNARHTVKAMLQLLIMTYKKSIYINYNKYTPVLTIRCRSCYWPGIKFIIMYIIYIKTAKAKQQIVHVNIKIYQIYNENEI